MFHCWARHWRNCRLVRIDGSDALDGASEGLLFDLESDPGEQRNLWDDPGAAGKKQELLDELLKWRLDNGWRSARWSEAFR